MLSCSKSGFRRRVILGITRVHNVNRDGRRVTLEAASIPFAIRLRSNRCLRLATEGGVEDGPSLLAKMYARGLSIGESRVVGPR